MVKGYNPYCFICKVYINNIYKIEELEFLDRLEACKDSEIRGLATAIIRKNSVGEYHNTIGKSGQKIMNTILKWMEED